MNYQEQKTEKERQKMLQREASSSSHKKKRLKKHITTLLWILIMILIVAGIAWLVILSRPEPIGDHHANQGREHIAQGIDHHEYNSNPPTSGSHHASAANWGIYENPLPDETFIHNLEHGGIWISYKNLNSQQIGELKKFAKKHPQSVVLSPREANDSKIALAAWTKLFKMDKVDVEKLEQFYKANKNKSPEPLAGK